MLLLTACCVLLGWLGSALVRSGPPAARAAAALAVALLAAAVLVPPRVEQQTLPPAALVLTTRPDAGGRIAARLREALPEGAAVTVEAVRAGETLTAAAARLALAPGSRLCDLAVLWNGPIAAFGPAPAAPFVGAAWTEVEPLAFDPAAIELSWLSKPRQGRPAAGIVTMPAVAGGSGEVRIEQGARGSDQDGLRAAAGVPFEVVPEQAGEARASVTADLEGRAILRRGGFVVAGPERVLVLDDGDAVARALAAQGLAVERTLQLPEDLRPFDGLALGRELSEPEQYALLAAIDDGLGLFAYGRGLQAVGAPLAVALPVRRLPPRPQENAPGAGDEGASPAQTAPTPKPQVQPPPVIEDPQIAPGGPVEVERKQVAMVLIVDRSGSMGQQVFGGETKMGYAKLSALQTARALSDGDLVGVVTFGNEGLGRIELPLCDVADKAKVEQGIARLAASREFTYLQSGLELAQQMLAQSRAAVRHAVVISDGEVYDSELVLRALAAEGKKRGVTLSLISIVDDSTKSEFLAMAELVSREGGGRYFPMRDAAKVPQIVSAEVVRSLDRVGRTPRGAAEPLAGGGGEPERPKPEDPKPEDPKPEENEPDPKAKDEPRPDDLAADADSLRPIQVRAVAVSPTLEPRPFVWPALYGIEPAAALATAQVLLVAGAEGLPVLAYRNHGLGRIGVFASDLGGAAGRDFVAEGVFPARIARFLGATLRAEAELPTNVLDEVEVRPPAPLPREAEAMAALCGAAPQPFEAFAPPPARTERIVRSQAPFAALLALFLLLLLAGVERLCVQLGLSSS